MNPTLNRRGFLKENSAAGLAGMRVGYMISSPETARMPGKYILGDYTLNQAGMAAAIASYNDTKFLAMTKSQIFEGREVVAEARV